MKKIFWMILFGVFTFSQYGCAQDEIKTPQMVAPETGQADDAGIEELKLFSKAFNVIIEAYPENLIKRQLLYEAVKGMLGSLDKYSEFIDPERYELLQIHMRGEYAGIGILLEKLNEFPMVRGVQPKSVAEQVGLKPGDLIIQIDGVSTQGLEIPDVSKQLRGEAGSQVRLMVLRHGVAKPFEIEIVREKIELEAIQESKIIEGNIGYLHLVSWTENTAKQFDDAITRLMELGMKSLVIDLRNNDGGLMPQAVELARHFLPVGSKIVTVDSKIEEQRKIYSVESDPKYPNLPLAILINEKSASASEIFSASMQDHHRAIVVGLKSYGKASVQSVIPLDDESAMKLTTARYLSPNGRDINHIGIDPDISVNIGTENPANDLQLVKAIEVLRNA